MCFSIGRTLPWLHCSKLILSRSFWLFHGQKDVQAVSFWEIQVRWQVFPPRELTYHTYPLWKTLSKMVFLFPRVGYDRYVTSLDEKTHLRFSLLTRWVWIAPILPRKHWETWAMFLGGWLFKVQHVFFDPKNWDMGKKGGFSWLQLWILIFFSDCWPDGSPVFFFFSCWCWWLVVLVLLILDAKSQRSHPWTISNSESKWLQQTNSWHLQPSQMSFWGLQLYIYWLFDYMIYIYMYMMNVYIKIRIMVSQVSYLSWFPNIRCLNQHLHLSFLSAQSVAKRKRGKAGAKVKLQLAEPCGHAPSSRDPIGSRIALPSQTFFRPRGYIC